MPYPISAIPTIRFRICIIITGIALFNIEKIITDKPIKIKVAEPTAKPNAINCFFVYLYSIAFAANKLVKKTIVIGLVIVRKKTDRKLEFRLVDSIIAEAAISLFMTSLMIITPNNIRTVELIIPNILLEQFSYSE